MHVRQARRLIGFYMKGWKGKRMTEEDLSQKRRMDSQGRLRIPARMIRALGAKPGDAVNLWFRRRSRLGTGVIDFARLDGPSPVSTHRVAKDGSICIPGSDINGYVDNVGGVFRLTCFPGCSIEIKPLYA